MRRRKGFSGERWPNQILASPCLSAKLVVRSLEQQFGSVLVDRG